MRLKWCYSFVRIGFHSIAPGKPHLMFFIYNIILHQKVISIQFTIQHLQRLNVLQRIQKCI